MDILKLLADNPTSFTATLISVIALVFYCGGMWTSMKDMRIRMVTKIDLELAMMKLKEELALLYVSRAECEIKERKKYQHEQ